MKTIMKIFKKCISVFLVVPFIINFILCTAYCKNTKNTHEYKPKVSVIIPVYNSEPWLKECIDSIRNQTLKDIQIICVDDGSTDKSGQMLDEYKNSDERFIVVHQKNMGIAMARQTGLDLTTGEYITFCDSDDVLQPNAYEVAYKAAHDTSVKDNIDIVQFKFRSFVEEKDSHTVETDNYYSNSKIMTRNECITNYNNFGPHVWSKIFKSEIIKKDNVRFIKGFMVSDDACFAYMALARAKTVKYIPTVLYNYRLRNNSVYHKNKLEKMFFNDYKLIKYVSDDWVKYGYSNGIEHLLLNRLCRWAYYWCPKGSLKYSRGVLSSFNSKIYNPKVVKKCDDETKKIIRKLKDAALKSKRRAYITNLSKKSWKLKKL